MSVNLPEFIFVCAQNGAEGVCKREILQQWPKLRFAFSRPGFLTFKLTVGFQFEPRFDLKSVFARCSGFSTAKLAWDGSAEFAAKMCELLASFHGQHIHIWNRDLHLPGTILKPHELQPGQSTQLYVPGTSAKLSGLVDQISNLAESIDPGRFKINCETNLSDRVFDVIMVEPDQIWTGWHIAASFPSRWPGGIPRIETPERMISRAYLKISEALQWSRLPLQAGDLCVEIGAAPGGNCQALLGRGAKVIGVDPAEMDPEISAHPNFTYMRCRGAEIRCRDLRHVKWLFADTNVAPKHTLDTIERIVTNEAVHIRGMILTIKLPDLELAVEVADYLSRIRGWGFGYVKARQLAYNRNEFCVAALRNKGMLRFEKRSARSKRREDDKTTEVEPPSAVAAQSDV